MTVAARRSYKDLSLAQLRSFCEICRLGRYTAAARTRLLTVPAVWEQMQGLERYYGISLLVTPSKHPLLRRRALHLRHVLEFRLVLGEAVAYSRHRVQEVLHRHALEPEATVAVETSSDEYTLSCVRAGLGVGITIGTGH